MHYLMGHGSILNQGAYFLQKEPLKHESIPNQGAKISLDPTTISMRRVTYNFFQMNSSSCRTSEYNMSLKLSVSREKYHFFVTELPRD